MHIELWRILSRVYHRQIQLLAVRKLPLDYLNPIQLVVIAVSRLWAQWLPLLIKLLWALALDCKRLLPW